MRREHDLLGELDIPEDAYYGIQTFRSVENFQITGLRLCDFPDFIKGLAYTKQAAADGAALAKKLTNGEIDIVTFTSSSTAKNLCAILGGAEPLQHVKCVAIGPITAKTCEALGIRPAAVAKEYTIEGLIETIKEMLLC